MKKMKLGWKIFLVTISVIIVLVVGTKYLLGNSLEKLANTPIKNVDLSQVDDGVYAGSYESFPVSAEVSVTVAGHRITKIDLIRHVTGKGKAAEVLPAKVVESQTLEVDCVSGATYSSKVILKAIENALTATK